MLSSILPNYNAKGFHQLYRKYRPFSFKSKLNVNKLNDERSGEAKPLISTEVRMSFDE